jgi:hypothetical protein
MAVHRNASKGRSVPVQVAEQRGGARDHIAIRLGEEPHPTPRATMNPTTVESGHAIDRRSNVCQCVSRLGPKSSLP